MKPYHVIFTLGIALFFSSCLQIGAIDLRGKESTLTAAQKIKKFMKNNKNPSILVRVTRSKQFATEGDPTAYAYLYNAIENELAKAGFEVRDRGLFNSVLETHEKLDYHTIRELTNTDLILEVAKVDLDVRYTTNRFLTKRGESKASEDYEVSRSGADFELKLVIANGNEYGGNYSFSYTPCSTDEMREDCDCKIGYKIGPGIHKIYPKIDVCALKKKERRKEGFEEVEEDQLEAVVRDGVQKMVKAIR